MRPTQVILRNELARVLNEKQDVADEVPALLGAYTAQGTLIAVPGNPDYCYARLRGNDAEVVKVFNDTVLRRFNTPIKVVWISGRWEVVGRNTGGSPGGFGGQPFLPNHALQHMFYGGTGTNYAVGDDVVWVNKQQWMPLNVVPTTPASMRARVWGDYYMWAGVYHWYPGTDTADMTALVPASSAQARFVTVYIDASENLGYVTGSLFAYTGAIINPEPVVGIPPVGAGIVLAAMLLNGHYSTIDWGYIWDMRSVVQGYGDPGTGTHPPVTLSVDAGLTFILNGQQLDVQVQDPHEFWAGPTGGVAAKPTWRTIGSSDLPWFTGSTGVGDHAILSTTHLQTTPDTIVRGDIPTGQGVVPTLTRMALSGITGSVVTRDATDVLWSTGALSFAGAFTLTVPATGTTALLGTANAFTVGQTVTVADMVVALTLAGASGNLRFSPYFNSTYGAYWYAKNTADDAFIPLSILASYVYIPTANLKLGSNALRATTEGTTHLDLFNGTAPVGTLANGVSLYSASGEIRVMNSAGVVTLSGTNTGDVTLASPNHGLGLTNQVITLGTPSTLTSATTNAVTTTTHTHAITVAPALVGVGTVQYQFLVTGATPFNPGWSAGYLNITSAKTLTVTGSTTLANAAITLENTGSLTLAATGFSLLGGGTSCSLTLPNAATTISGGGTLALGTYTLTVPKTGTAVTGTGTAGRIAEWVTDVNTLQASTLIKTGTNTLTLATGAAAATVWTIPINAVGVLTNDGAGNMSWADASAYVTQIGSVTAGRIASWTGTYQIQESVLIMSGANVLTLAASATATLTVPATGTAALLGTANAFTDSNTIASGKFLTALTDGATGGLQAGSVSDVLWYRGGADTWRTPDSLIIDGVLTVTGGQITFPAVQAASAGVNTLDDYEEGTVTVTLTCGTSGTVTLNINTLSYTKIGRLVTVTGLLNVSSVSSPVGILTLNGLPFTCANGIQFYSAVAVYGSNLINTATTMLTGYVAINTTTAIVQKWSAGNPAALAADIQANTQLMFSITYFSA